MTLISEAERRRRLAAAREAVEKGLPMAAPPKPRVRIAQEST